ncbi:MAG: T9SS type A sorting domain-containing protein [Saprospiraceae bacterium]|nr:T9SS type A sorting domain-containing protein [Saprospiraceae bacterium]
MLYGAMRGSRVSSSGLPSPEVYLSRIKALSSDDTLPIAVLALRFDRIRPDAIDSNLLSYVDGQMFDVTGRTESPYFQDTVFAAMLLKGKTTSRSVSFTLPADLWFSNLSGSAPVISLDPGDGQGWRILSAGQTLATEYPSTGEKEVVIRLEYTGFTRYSHSKLNVTEMGAGDRNGGMIWPQDLYESMHITATESYMGLAGGATLHFFYNTHNCNSVKRMVRPLIVVEGYEEFGVTESSYDRMFALLNLPKLGNIPNEESLTDYLYPYEYDLIYVDFDDGSDWIQRNAFVVKEVIKLVNEMKAESGSTEENVIIGVSMGGVVSKYALLEMQANGPDHDTRLFFTYDSPLHGANIPIATQYLIAFMVANLTTYVGDDISLPSIDLIWEALHAPVPLQLLKYHVNNGSIPGNDIHSAFMTELDALGALNMRHVALSNGAGTGTFIENNIVAGERFFELGGKKGKCEPVCGHVRFDIKLRATGGNGMNTLFYGYIERQLDFIPIDLIWTEWIVNSITKPYDSSPGGASNLGTAPLGSGEGGLIDLLTEAEVSMTGPGLTATHHCFIPTFSSVDASEPSNLGSTFGCGAADRCTTSSTPEQSDYSGLPEINQRHVFLDERIALVMIDELVTNSPPPLVHPLSLSGDLNTYFNVGLPIYSPIPTVTIHTSNGKLSINNTGKVAFATGNEPNSPYQFLFSETRCNAVITVEDGAKLVVGADGAVKDGVLKLDENSTVHIKSGGILQITGEHSSLIIKHGTRLILDPGAKVILESQGSNIRIEGELVVNGNFNFSGLGHFVFAEGNQLTFGNNLYTFFLEGQGISQRFVLLEAPVHINGLHRLLWTDGLVEITYGNLNFTNGAGADFERVTFTGGDNAIFGNQASGINLLSCVLTGITDPIQGVESVSLYVNQCQFDSYNIGIYWANSNFFNVVNSTFTGQSLAKAMDLQNVVLAVIGGDYIAGHSNGAPSGQIDDDYFEGTGQIIPAVAVELNNVDYCFVRNSQINSNDVGIRDLNDVAPSSVFLFQGTTFFENAAGVYMKGNATEGLVLADCATFARNKYGIRGSDITLMIDALNSSTSPIDEDQPNAFLRNPIPQGGGANNMYIQICYAFKEPLNSIYMRKNYWGTLFGAGEPWIYEQTPEDYILLKRLNCSQLVSPVVIPRVGREPELCELPERPTTDFTDNDSLSACTIGINSTFGLLHEQYHYAYYLLKADSVELARQAFEPLAALWSEDMSGYPANCRQYIAVARAIVSGAGEQLRPEGRDVSSSSNIHGLAVWPNPAGQTMHVLLPETLCTLRVWDPFGRMVETRTASGAIQLKVEQWPSGVYYMESVSSDGKRKSAKVAVTH